MSPMNYHSVCSGNVGRPVEIRTHGGIIHRGIISHVDHQKVFIRPFEGRRNLGGFGYGFWGPRWGWGWGVAGFGIGVAFGAIATLAFLPWFFW